MLPEFTVCDDALTVGSSSTVNLFSLAPTRRIYVRQIEVTFRGVTTAGQEPRVRIHRKGDFTLSGGTTRTPVPLDSSSDPATSTTVCRSLPTVGSAAADADRIATGTYQGGVSRVFLSPLVIQSDEQMLIVVENGTTALTADVFVQYVETI